jgi:hypothetical protein
MAAPEAPHLVSKTPSCPATCFQTHQELTLLATPQRWWPFPQAAPGPSPPEGAPLSPLSPLSPPLQHLFPVWFTPQVRGVQLEQVQVVVVVVAAVAAPAQATRVTPAAILCPAFKPGLMWTAAVVTPQLNPASHQDHVALDNMEVVGEAAQDLQVAAPVPVPVLAVAPGALTVPPKDKISLRWEPLWPLPWCLVNRHLPT